MVEAKDEVYEKLEKYEKKDTGEAAEGPHCRETQVHPYCRDESVTIQPIVTKTIPRDATGSLQMSAQHVIVAATEPNSNTGSENGIWKFKKQQGSTDEHRELERRVKSMEGKTLRLTYTWKELTSGDRTRIPKCVRWNTVKFGKILHQLWTITLGATSTDGCMDVELVG